MREQIVVRLLAGEALSSKMAKTEFRSTNDHLVDGAVKHLQRQGHTFVRELGGPRGTEAFWHLVPPTPSPEESAPPDEPDEDFDEDHPAVSRSRQLEELFRSGAELTSAEAEEQYGFKASLFHFVVKRMRSQGVGFKVTEHERTSTNGRPYKVSSYAIAGPDEEASEPRRRGRNGPTVLDGMSMDDLPQLWEEVTITLLAVMDDGQIAIGFRNGRGSWVTKFSGRG